MTTKIWKKCRKCGISFDKNLHYAKGLCITCYSRIKTKNYVRKMMKKDPDWNARKQRKFRKKNPITFNRLMASYYLRKLPKEEKLKLFKKFGG